MVGSRRKLQFSDRDDVGAQTLILSLDFPKMGIFSPNFFPQSTGCESNCRRVSRVLKG